MGKYGLHGGEKNFIKFQLRAYRGFTQQELEGKTLQQLRDLFHQGKQE